LAIHPVKRGALHRQLGIPPGKKIPKTLAIKITHAETGEYIKNPTKVGDARIKVTPKMRKRAFFVTSFY
jgi:hypothetical protein